MTFDLPEHFTSESRYDGTTAIRFGDLRADGDDLLHAASRMIGRLQRYIDRLLATASGETGRCA